MKRGLWFLRIGCSLFFFCLITYLFIDFTGAITGSFAAQLQFIPALLALNITVLILWLLLTCLFGRVYCSFLCPLGTLLDIVNYSSKKLSSAKKFTWRPALHLPRYLLLAIAALATLSGYTLAAALLDPYSIYGRITVHLLKPAYIAGNNLLAELLTRLNRHFLYRVELPPVQILAIVVAGISLLIVLYLGWKYGRLYCNMICPVGTILGVISRYSLFRIKIDRDACNNCGLCERICKASCINSHSGVVDSSRCVACFDCLSVCARGAVSFSRRGEAAATDSFSNSSSPLDPARRRFLFSTLPGFLAAPAFSKNGRGMSTEQRSQHKANALTPPGSISKEHLLNKCTACQLCISKCPAGILSPALHELGPGGILMPVMKFDKGFCNYDCTVCSNVCPTGALKPLTKDKKHQTQTGIVTFTLSRCIVHTDKTSCGACAEHCPTQAVSMSAYRDGLTIPTISEDLCVGCGGCEYICPAQPRKAIRVEGLAVHAQARISKVEKGSESTISTFGF